MLDMFSLLQYVLLLLILFARCKFMPIISPQIAIKLISENMLEVSCKDEGNTSERKRIYRENINNNMVLAVSIQQSQTQCEVSAEFSAEAVQCYCLETLVACNISDVHKEGEKWKCATFLKGIPIYSNTETVHINSTGSSKETTAASTTEASIVLTTSPNGVDGIWVTAISQGHFSGITENNTTLLFEYFTNETTVLNNKSHGNRETTEFTTVQNALLYQKFIIIIGSLAVAVVLIAASVLICGYRKYYHLSDALELATATTDVPVDTFQRTSIPMLEDVPDNRHSTLEIYETIPMTNVSPLSPMADSYPLTQEVRILANLFEFGSESSVGSLHYYETVPDTINNDVASSDGAEENTSVHAPTHVLYESLLRSSTDVKEQYTTKASS